MENPEDRAARERVLRKKFGGDLKLPSGKTSSPFGGMDWPGVVVGGGGPEDDAGDIIRGGVGIANPRPSVSGPSGKKAKELDAGIAPWLAADYGTPTHGRTLSDHSIHRSSSATHLSSNGGSFSSSTPLPRPSRQSTVSTMLGSEKKPRGSKDTAASGERPSSSGGGDEKRKKSAFLGGLQFVKRKAGGSSSSRGKEEARHASRLASSASSYSSYNKPTESHSGHSSSTSTGMALPALSTISAAGEGSPNLGRDSSPDSTKKSRKNSKKSSNASPNPATDMYTLDTDLDHMEGIVNPTYGGSTINSSMDSRTGAWSDATGTSQSFSSSGTRQIGSEGSTTGMPFTNPFNPGSQSPEGTKITGLFSSTLPRRPSQLRTVATPSEEGVNPFDILPLKTPANYPHGDNTTFSNPFAGATGRTPNLHLNFSGLDASHSPLSTPAGPSTLAPVTPSALPAPPSNPIVSVAPPIRPTENAWIAPESWGVEGDLPDDDEDSSGEDAEGPSLELLDTLNSGVLRNLRPPGTPGLEADEFNWGGTDGGGSGGSRPATGGSVAGRSARQGTLSAGGAGRPSTAGARPSTAGGRPGTGSRSKTGSGSAAPGQPVYLRVYRSDGSHTTVACALSSTTSEIIAILSVKNLQPKGGYRLYIRERRADRPLDPREKPALIQKRRLIQAGYDETDKIEVMGKDDLAMLCKFIYRLPKMAGTENMDESSFDSFEHVDLSGRDIQIFPIFLHRHAGSIIHLNLSQNQLSELPSDFIQDCVNLRELKLSEMALKRVPPSIRQSSSLTRLDVSSNRIGDLDMAGLEQIPGLMSLKLQNNRLSVLPSYFAHSKSLKYLNISNNNFEAFPSIVCEIKSLIDLDISFNGIAYLPPEIGKLTNLDRLVLVGNVITALPQEFTKLENLREFDCRRNRIADFSPVYALPKLEVLKAERNEVKLIDAQFGPKMTDINLAYNSITRLSFSLRSSDTSYGLTSLDLSNAKLSSIAEDVVSELRSLLVLKLNGNTFARLPESVTDLTKLRELHCTDNSLTALPAGIDRLQQLEIINVHNNNLTFIPVQIWSCGRLVSLNASSNLLETFPDPPESLPPLLPIEGDEGTVSPPRDLQALGKSLRSLQLCDNRLTDDVFHPVSLLTVLRTLNLSFNEILEVPSWTLRKNSALTALYLSGNKLTSLPSEDLEKLRSLMILHVNGNKLQSLPAELSNMSRLTVLDVGSNVLKYNINNWRYDWNWTKNTELRYLNLSGNKRFEIKPSDRNQLDNMMGSGAKADYGSSFNTLTHIRTLGLMDVTLRVPVPDETDDRRVRTSDSVVNNMSYGFSDSMGQYEHLQLSDLVVPNFRGKDKECLFGIFGRAHVPNRTLVGRIPRYATEWFSSTFADQLNKIDVEEGEDVSDALRRSFLTLNKNCYEEITARANGDKRKGSQGSTMGPSHPPVSIDTGALFKTGASAVIAYIADKTLYVANAGKALAVVSRKGSALETLTSFHDPFERTEATRIRLAEAWISPRGLICEELDISRGFGFYHLFPAVNARPDVRAWNLTEADEFVILGSEGMWDFISYQTAVDIARTEKDDPMMAAQKLRDLAISYGADGAIMVMIIGVGDLFKPQGQAHRKVALDGAFDSKRVARRGRTDLVGDRTLARLDREIEPPTGQVALVFTDIKNSTALWETNQGMQTAIKMHNHLLRRQLRTIGGYEVKTEGDAFMVSFPTVASAVLWCFTCQLMLLQEDWPREILEAEDGKEIFTDDGELIYRGLWVRMGIHWGMPVCEADPITKRMDYFGPIVNRAARISGAADGGQIMVSQDVVNEMQSLYDSLDAPDAEGANAIEEEEEKFSPHIAQLRKLGFGVTMFGERKLKGLENLEKLSLVFPAALQPRLKFTTTRETLKPATLIVPKAGVLHADEVRSMALICLRLESLSASGQTLGQAQSLLRSETDNRASRFVGSFNMDLLLPHISPEMTDDDLLTIVNSLSVRIENALSSLYMKHLGGFSTVLGALGQGVSIEPNLLVHALGLFSNLLANH